ncbi:hypothetical protein GQF03_10595 [Sneathiella chungangensis]|uniref:Uncharacterized protein n=1 Tax=Sneathiella chungangensis TaxID=1418234 RepID=A0A845MFM4_9PROT|nr:DUF6522 family protein [Sneathiella chungangensis]MZR22778.1 hypothetical protein [Sneathiella chungangensis]
MEKVIDVLSTGPESDIEVEAEVIANGLGMSVAKLQSEMRKGEVTSRVEQGMEEDQGRLRLTFSFDRRQFQIIADTEGRVIKSSSINFGRRVPAKQKP